MADSDKEPRELGNEELLEELLSAHGSSKELSQRPDGWSHAEGYKNRFDTLKIELLARLNK